MKLLWQQSKAKLRYKLEEASIAFSRGAGRDIDGLGFARYDRHARPGIATDDACVGRDSIEKEYALKSVTSGIQLVSAFVDRRPTDFESRSNDSVLVRLVSIVQKEHIGQLRQLACHFDVNNETWRSPVEFLYESAENHHLTFGAHIVSCELPAALRRLPPCVVRVSAGSGEGTHSVSVRLHSSRRAHRYNFTVCVPPLFGNINEMHIVEFVELLRLLGADHFVFYDYAASTAVRSLLAYYQSNGVVTVVPWPLDSRFKGKIWNYGQTAAIHDCLFRTMGVSTFAVFADFDEYLVPVHHATWGRLTANLSSDDVGYVFESVFFDPRLQGVDGGAVVGGDTIGLRSVRHTLRSYHTSTVRTKCMVRPEYIFEQGIHHVSKPVRAVLHVSRVSPDIAVIHHHRTCDSRYGMQCKPIVQDRTAARHADKLQHAVAKLLKAFHVL